MEEVRSDAIDQIDLGEEMLPAAGAVHTHRVQDPLFGRLRNSGSVEIDTLLRLVALEGLQLGLVITPKRCDLLAATHTANRNDHFDELLIRPKKMGFKFLAWAAGSCCCVFSDDRKHSFVSECLQSRT